MRFGGEDLAGKPTLHVQVEVVGVIDDAKAGPMLYDRESDTLSATVRYRIKPNDGGKPVWMPPTSLPGKDTP